MQLLIQGSIRLRLITNVGCIIRKLPGRSRFVLEKTLPYRVEILSQLLTSAHFNRSLHILQPVRQRTIKTNDLLLLFCGDLGRTAATYFVSARAKHAESISNSVNQNVLLRSIISDSGGKVVLQKECNENVDAESPRVARPTGSIA